MQAAWVWHSQGYIGPGWIRTGLWEDTLHTASVSNCVHEQVHVYVVSLQW